jgi:hypothetical protein
MSDFDASREEAGVKRSGIKQLVVNPPEIATETASRLLLAVLFLAAPPLTAFSYPLLICVFS